MCHNAGVNPRRMLDPDRVHLVFTTAPLVGHAPAVVLLLAGRLFAGEWPHRAAPDAQALLGQVWFLPVALLYEAAGALFGFAFLAWPFLTFSLHRACCLPPGTLTRRALVFAAGLLVTTLAAPALFDALGAAPWMRTLPLFGD